MQLTTSEILDLRDALQVLENDETDSTIKDAFAPIYSIINNEIDYMRQKLADIEYTNATPETFQKGFKGFDEYTDKEILDQYDFYTN